MSYTVFISHSASDQRLVTTLSNTLSRMGINVYVAEWYLAPGTPVSRKVFEQIDNSNCVVAVLTRNGIRSQWVHQEIGYARKANKPIIPLVEKGVRREQLASLQGIAYIEYSPYTPTDAIIKLSTFIKSQKLKKEEQEETLLVGGALLTLLLLLLLSGEKK